MAKKDTSLAAAVSAELRGSFDLNKFKEKKLLSSNVKFKDQKWIPLSKAFQDVTSVPGIPQGHIVLLRGHSDTGKTTALIEAAVAAQKKGNLPYELLFLWDSIGSIPCELSIRSNKNNNEWNAGAMSTQFGNSVNQRITLSRKESSKYTNTLVCINKVWTAKAEMPMG